MATDVLCLLTNHFKTATSDWSRIADALQVAFTLPDDVLLAERPATTFILTWMREIRTFQKQFGLLFGRQKQPPLADDFTASVALCLEQFLTVRGYKGRVQCEKTTEKKRGATRPDLQVLSAADRLVTTVECKTNLGWSRKKWKQQCETRDAALREQFPGCLPYLCVLTQKNWDSSEFLTSPYCRKQWFCLSKVGIRKIADPAKDVLHPIEEMFLSILRQVAK
jgi:hypothetical protein